MGQMRSISSITVPSSSTATPSALSMAATSGRGRRQRACSRPGCTVVVGAPGSVGAPGWLARRGALHEVGGLLCAPRRGIRRTGLRRWRLNRCVRVTTSASGSFASLSATTTVSEYILEPGHRKVIGRTVTLAINRSVDREGTKYYEDRL